MTVNEKLKEARESKGIKIKDVSNKTKIPSSTISRIESGKIKSVNPKNLYELSNYYDLFFPELILIAYDIPIHELLKKENNIGKLTEEEEGVVRIFLQQYRELKNNLIRK